MNILELLSSRGLHPRQVSANKGGEYACACPGCGGADKPGNPSDRFHAFPNQEGGPLCQEASAPGTYWCRKCGAGGDLLQYLIDFEHMSFAAACAELGAKLPTNLPVRGRLPLPPKITEAPAFVPTAEPRMVQKMRGPIERVLRERGKLPVLERLAEEYAANARPGDVRAHMDAVELTSNRAGALLSGDLQVARRLVLEEKAQVSKLQDEAKVRDLVQFCLSEDWAVLRDALGLSVAAR